MATLQSSGLNSVGGLKSIKNVNKKVMPGVEEIEDLEKFNPDVAGTANPMLAPAPTQNMPQPAIGSQVSAQSYDTRANQVMAAPPAPVAPPQPVMANPNPPPSQEPGAVERKLGENLPSAAGIQQPQGQPQPHPEMQPQVPAGNVAPNFSKDRGYGLREDGTHKGKGFYGEMPMKDGQHNVFGEISISEDLDGSGRQVLMPSVVPGLNAEQLDALSKDAKNSFRPDIYKIAVEHARNRIAQGLPTFATEAEEGQTPIPTSEAGAQAPYGPQLPPYPLLGSGLKSLLSKNRNQQQDPQQEQYGPQLPPYPLLGSGLKGIWENVKQKQKEPMIGQETIEKGYKSAIPDFSFEQSPFDKEVEKRSQEYGRRFPSWGPQKPLEAEQVAGLEQPLSPKEHPEVQAYFSPVDEVANSPEHQEVFEKQSGSPFTPKIKQDAEIGQEAKDYLDSGEVDSSGLSDQSKRLVDRIKSNQATDDDMYMIGLAVLMPLIVGGMFGKEAGFGALAGGMKGVSDVYEGRKKDTQEAEKLLAEIDKTKATQQLAAAKGDIGGSYSDAEWVDEKGQKIPVKEIGHGIYIDPKHLKSKAQEKAAQDQKTEILKKIEASYPLIDSAKIILEVTRQMEDPSFWKQMRNYVANNFDPQLGAKLSQEVIIDGERVNAATALRKAINQTNAHFARQNQLGQADSAEQKLFGGMLTDPTVSFTNPEQTFYQATGFLNDTLKSLNRKASIYGMHLDPNVFDFEAQEKEIKGSQKKKREAEQFGSMVSGFVERGE